MKTAKEIISKINPSTPHSLTVWTDEMVIQAMHEYASQVAEAVGFPTVSELRKAARKHPDTFLAGALYVIDLLENQPSSRNQQNGVAASPVDGREWVRVEDLPTKEDARYYCAGAFGYEIGADDNESAFMSGFEWTIDQIKSKLPSPPKANNP